MSLSRVVSDGTSKGMLVGVFHIILIIAAYTSPFWLDWRVVLAGVTLLSLQFIILGGCVLNALQYGEGFNKTNFGLYERILKELGVQYNKRRLRFFLDWIMPSLVLAIALLWQLVLGYSSLVKF